MGGNAAAQAVATGPRSGSLLLGLAALLGSVGATAVTAAPSVVATDRAVVVDGMLDEWAVPEPLHIRPGDGPVGVRGGFNGASDHYVDIYLMWSAAHLYVAVAVEDDRQDAVPIAPEEYVWEGPGGARKDRMYYYDHLKVFLRGPKANLGYNLWVAPVAAPAGDGAAVAAGAAHVWGSQQRSSGTVDIPVAAASAAAAGLYTYELAIPWAWLQVHPAEGMLLDSMFLLPDSDMPEVALDEKIAGGNKWIWWKEKIRLAGTPPGWEPPPESIVAQVERGIEEFKETVPRIASRPAAPMTSGTKGNGEAGRSEAMSGIASDGPEDAAAGQVEATARPVTAAKDAAVVAAAPVEAGKVSPYLPDLTRVERVLRRRPTAPAFVGGLTNQVDEGQARVLFRSLGASLRRLSREGISGRIDVIVADAAAAAGTEKEAAREFVIQLLGRVLDDLKQEGSGLRLGLAEIAADQGVELPRLVEFTERGAGALHKWFEKNNLFGLHGVGNVPTTGDVLEKAAGKTEISNAQARAAIVAGLDYWILQ